MEDLKDVIFIVTVIVSIASSYFALKYKTEGNHTKINEEEKSFEKFKEFSYKELKGIDEQVKQINMNLQNMITRKEADEKYITKRESELIMENIGLKFSRIMDRLDDLKKGEKQ